MATPVSVTVILWLLSPIFIFLVNKFLFYFEFNHSRKLRELEQQTIPSLEQTIGDVTEQRMLRGAKDKGKGSGSHLKKLGALDKDLKSALYEAQDVLDVVEYRRIKKTVIGGTSICSWVKACIASCKRSSFGQKLWQRGPILNQKLRYLGDKLQQYLQDLDLKFWELVAKLQQYAQNLKQIVRDLPLRAPIVQCAQRLRLYIHRGAAGQTSMPDAPAAESRDDIEQGSATTPSPTPDDAPSNPPFPNAVPNSAGSATEFRGDNQHGSAEEAPTLDAHLNSLVQMTWDGLVYGFSLLRFLYSIPRFVRDWPYEKVGIKNDDWNVTDWVLLVNEIISLRKRIKNVEYIDSESKKSPLLNRISSSSPKDTDKESNSSCTVKNSAEESTSTQKEIDSVYRSIEKDVFGRDQDRKNISEMLRKGPDAYAASSSTSKPYSVIGIYGIPGSGKSTLAQYVCDYEKETRHFNLIMFVPVGKTFRVGDIFRQMLWQIKQSGSSNDKDLISLKTELSENLKGKRFLLVLDDLWVNDNNQNGWDILLDTLCAGRSGSRVLVTAQKADAAGALGAHLQQFSIPDLEEEVYLSLLMHHAGPFAAKNDYAKYERIGMKIANRLGRSPIAAVTVGKQLQRNKSMSFWEATANLDVLNETMGALWWSYQQLGVDIRRCFAYCSTFPKGYEFEPDELVRIWIAQGFVNTRSNATEELEDLGQRYLDELLTFSFLQERSKIWFPNTITIHDLLHEFAERVSGSECFRIGLNGSPEDIPRGVHHLFIENTDGAEIAEKLVEVENLRTLIIEKKFHASEKLLERLFMRMTKLRVLIIKQNYIARELSVSVPACIDQMKHLRYLGLHFHGAGPVLILPSTFSKLYHIEIIDIPLARASYPEDMANLINLRHIPDWLSFPNIGRLTSLRTMRCFAVKEEQGYELKQLKHLNKLGGTLWIRGLGIVGSKEEALEAHLADKKRLKELELDFRRDRRFGPEVEAEVLDVEAEVLEGLCPPKDLEDLRIYGYGGSRYPSWMLSGQHLDALYRLELWGCSCQLASIPEDSKVLTGLRQLLIYDCDWDRLPENMERLESLQALVIRFCDKIELLPTLPQKCLNTIAISGCRMLSGTCKVKRHPNWHKVQHIREKDID